jgi:phenylalanyl-tRNA synthetase beta chain
LRVSLEWLGDYVDLTIGPEELADRLTNTGTAVDGIEVIGGDLEGFRVGQVLEISSHPAAERLSVCRVDIGDAVLEIVCGARNVRPGVKAPVALPGSRLPDGTAIMETSIRGVASRGMLLSGKELGISDDAGGIMLLDEEVEVGTGLATALGMPDTILVLEVTPNRPDCLSMLGVAREVAAITGQSLKMPRFQLNESGKSAESAARVEIMDPDLCSRYAARVINGLAIGISPWWMQRRLQAAGVRPINNVVDITNYVMLELGQPLHAFDYDLVRDGHIIVRRAEDGETLTTLDGVARKLSDDDLLITDPSGPIALAGVMGGEHTEVGDDTTRVLLESAHFDPANIMRTSRVHDLFSEASYRFERGVDPNGCGYAADRAARLVQELARGEVMAGAVDVRARVIDPERLRLRVRRTGRLIGIPLRADEAEGLLRSIGLNVEGMDREGDDEVLAVKVPTYRPDLEREIDLVEEVARLYGYDRIPPTLPENSSNVGYLTREQKARRVIARVMNGLGLHEAITLAFISPTWMDSLDPGREYLPPDLIRLRNPISEEMSVMRPSLLPGLLEAVRFNLNRRVTDVFIFEMGRVFLHQPGEKLPREPLRLGCAMAGRWFPKQWNREPEEADFFTAKGLLESLLAALHVPDWSLERKELPFLHPSQSCAVKLGGGEGGYLGLIHPRVAREADLPENTGLMEIDVEGLIQASPELTMYREIPRYPSIQMDIAVVVREEADSREVETAIREAGGELLREVRLFDLYRGEQVGEGEKSLAYNLTFYAMDRTLRDEEARSACENIVSSLSERLGARLR